MANIAIKLVWELLSIDRSIELPVFIPTLAPNVCLNKKTLSLTNPCHFWNWRVKMKELVIKSRKFIFDHEESPLRNIPDLPTRHMILQILGWMRAGSFAVATGSYLFLSLSFVVHGVLIAAAAINVATYTAASFKPEVFITGNGRRSDGEYI